MINDNSERYGSITRFFHWVMAVLVLQQFFKFADRINEGEHWLGDTFGPWHVSIGAVILILAVVRLLWALKQKPQRPINPGFDGVIAKIAHRLMYFSMLIMPFLGALYIHGKGYPVKVFGYELIAQPADEVPWALALGEWHSPFAFLLIFLVIAHIAGALYHHFIQKDTVLKRMIG
ncbi:cytochrome b [Methylophaga sp. SB9B]|uniref:cytochrome b n=1 Tax=Methylophaga sp. SB9B TaxID=2570356 RepID=UPI0010A90AF9|nr:cytochrome b [Methylophaga sp. SB9B]THK41154.1 cytochrome b [Methylophaga sp. SB9B]